MTVTDSGGTKVHVYTYDSIYQIKEVDYPVGFEYLATDTAFHYDAAGNRSSVIGGSGVAVNQGKRRINPRSATRPQDHEPAGRLFICVLPGTLSPHPWDFPLCARGRIEEQATSYSYHVAPVPGPERRSGCFPAAPYPPLRRHECIRVEKLWQLLSRRSGMEDLTGGLEAEAFAGPMVDLADMGT
jgi:hypothetical protein